MKTLKDFGVDYKEVILANGVKLYSFYKPNSPIYFRVFFNAGSQFDGDKLGLAHFCEHMMVSGTEKYPTKAILNEKIQEIGARSNAFTYKQDLWLTIDLADKADLPKMFERVDQVLNKSIFALDIIEKERGAILAEQTRNKSNPSQYISVLQGSLIFQGTNIASPVLGTDESVKKITRDDLLNYREKYLTNGQVAYFISGDFDEQVVIGFLNSINQGRKPIESVKKSLPVIVKETKLIEDISNSEQNYISLGGRILPISDSLERVSGDIFNMIFGQGNISRLHKTLRNDLGLIYGVQSSINNNREFACFSVNTSCKTKDTDEVVKVIKHELAWMIEKGISEKELTQAKKNILRNLKFQSETAAFWVEITMMRELICQSEPILLDKYVKIMRSVSVGDINHFIKKYFSGVELLLAGIGNFSFKTQKTI
jgi:predicted Zn-dependent peptidase